MMENIKKNWKNILIILLVLFSLTKCTQSCNRESTISELENKNVETVVSKDSIIKTLHDSCTLLNTTIKVYQERVNGMKQSLDIQNEAAKRISDAKKNISVSVKK